MISKGNKLERAEALVALFKRAQYDARLMFDDKAGVFVGVRLHAGESLPVMKVVDIEIRSLPFLIQGGG